MMNAQKKNWKERQGAVANYPHYIQKAQGPIAKFQSMKPNWNATLLLHPSIPFLTKYFIFNRIIHISVF